MDGLNLYQFVKGNPVNSVDIGGMCEQTPEKDASQNRKRKSYPARKRPLYKYVASDSEDEGTEEITQVKAKKNPKTIKIREHHRHFLSRFKHYLYAGAIEQRVSPNRNFLIAPSSEFNPMKQDFRNLGYGKEYQESHTVALTVTPEAEASGGNNVQELIAEVAHTQMQNRKFNKIGGPGAYIDKAQKEGGLKLLRQIDYSKGANEENIKLAEEIKQQFIMAVGGKENPLAQSLVKQDIKSILDRGKEYYENPQHKNKKLTKRPQPANDNQPRKKPKMADAA